MKTISIQNRQKDGSIHTIIFPVKAISYISQSGSQILLSFNNRESITITGDNVKQIAEEFEKAAKEEK